MRACARCMVFKIMVPHSTGTPKVLYLKRFWAFRVCADVSHCFHRDSTEADLTTGVPDTTTGVADTTAGTAVSPKNGERFAGNGERFTENGERFSENGERFFLCTTISLLATANTNRRTANTATATAIPRAGTAISRTYLMCERFVKRSWNVGNAPAHPRALYLQGFQQICERWNLFFENQFSLLAQRMASREN